MKNIVLSIISILLLTSCGSSGQKKTEDTAEALLEVVDTLVVLPMENLIDNPNSLIDDKMSRLSYYTDSVSYLILGSKNTRGEENFIGRVMGVDFSDHFIFVNCGDKVLEFDRTGNFVRQIGIMGQGPEEFVFANLIRVREDEETVYIGTDRAILKYTFDGKFLGRISVADEYDRVMPLGNGIIALSYNNYYGKLNNRLIIRKEAGDTIRVFPNFINFEKVGKTMFRVGDPYNETFSECDGTIRYHEQYGDTIFTLTDTYDLEPCYVLNMGKYSIPADARPEALGNKVKIEEISSKYYKTKMIAVGQYVFIEYSMLNEGYAGDALIAFSVYDKKVGKLRRVSSSTNVKYVENGLENDIDGGYLFNPEGILPDGKTMYHTFLASTFQSRLEKFGLLENVKSPEQKKKLQELLAGLGEEDNLVIMFAKLK